MTDTERDRLTRVEERTERNAQDIEELARRQDNLEDLVATVKVLATRQEVSEKAIVRIDKNVESLLIQPRKDAHKLGYKIVEAIVAGGVAYVMVRLGLAT